MLPHVTYAHVKFEVAKSNAGVQKAVKIQFWTPMVQKEMHLIENTVFDLLSRSHKM